MEILQPYMGMIATAAVILAVLLLGLWLFKALNQRVRGRKGQRLGISEYHEIDKTRRLVLVRRDEMEHLILIGGAQDIVVESRIALASDMDEQPEPVSRAPIPIRSTPRAPVFAERRPSLRPVEPPLMSSRNFDEDSN